MWPGQLSILCPHHLYAHCPNQVSTAFLKADKVLCAIPWGEGVRSPSRVEVETNFVDCRQPSQLHFPRSPLTADHSWQEGSPGEDVTSAVDTADREAGHAILSAPRLSLVLRQFMGQLCLLCLFKGELQQGIKNSWRRKSRNWYGNELSQQKTSLLCSEAL